MESTFIVQAKSFTVSDEKAELQLEVIHNYLSKCYWSEGISKALVSKAIKNSLCFGLYHQQQQIGFARVTTDKTSFAYLADVFILPNYSGQGLGTKLIEFIMQHPDLQGLRRFMLCTKDAHGLYEKFGFSAVDKPEMMMQINQPNLYLTQAVSSE